MKLIVVAISFCISLSVLADVSFVRLQNQNGIFVIPKLSNESTLEAFDKYKQFIQNHPELVLEFNVDELKNLKIESEISTSQLKDKPIVMALANRDYDQSPVEKIGFQKRLEALETKFNQARVVRLPVAALGRFSLKQKLELMNELHSAASLMVAVGGPDVDPDAYHQENRSSRETNLIRDLEELFVLKFWIDKAKKPLVGICRGHQMIAVALGFKLIQHKDDHGDGRLLNHPIFMLPTTNKLLANAAQSELVVVNSYHHQAVDPNAPPPVYQKVEVAAIAPDGTIESLESKNGLIWTFQFHPEFMSNKFRHQIFKKIQKTLSPPSGARSCSTTHRLPN